MSQADGPGPGPGPRSRPASPDHVVDRRRSLSATSEKENNTFEDAVDTTEVRSLTKRTPSISQQQPSQAATVDPAATKTGDAPENIGKDDDKIDENDEKNEEDRGSPEEQELQQKASLASKRLSNTSNLDVVNLDDDNSPPPPPEPKDSPAETKEAPRTISLSNIASSLPAMPWSPPAASSPAKSPDPVISVVQPPPPPPAPAPAPAPGPPTRRLTSPFSWLSRNNTGKDKEPSRSPPPSQSPRRNTASSIATLTSNPDMMLSRLEEEKEGAVENGVNGTRNNLKDRFKMLRMREEAGISPSAVATDDQKGLSATVAALVSRSNHLTIGGATSQTHEGEDGDAASEPPPKSPMPVSPNLSLAPGTASGVTAGPSDMASGQVDWDLWQSVVYEGPAAVARTSPEELNRAIATGIPNAIRGVIWQVLAQSKNEELEAMYKELVVRGTEKERDRNSNGTSISAASNGNLGTQNDTNTSSASSVHSEPAGANGVTPPAVNEKTAEALQKAAQADAAEKKRRQKEDAAMIQKLEKTIRRDLGSRTSFSKYAASAGLQESLFGVCKAYALFDEGVGYAQGMNFLVMPILFNMPEEEAFCLLVRLMNHYHLRDLFVQDMPGLHMRLYQFERLLEDLEPALYCHLHRRGISPHLYATQWFLTLFAYRFPLQLVLRIYDLILSEGLSAILRFGLVLMQKNAATLLGMSDMAQLTAYLKDKLFDVYIDRDPSAGSILENGFFGSSSASIDKEVYRADQLVRDACEVKMAPETLKAYTAEWEEKTRAERGREAELEQLRAANASLAVRVRRLEERVETCDREQAALATELVHTKVDNEELRDENESLKGQVRELRVVIEKQPEELESAWRQERDDLMKRNEKVHEENQRLEKEMAELEEELVQTKMQYAEINSQHETLTRKWTDLKRQFA
ncbi:RabGAP/TBC [Sodiomyces alkalinus F11]|uniref:GTPase-activating protein GYP5 n=1 Tax=Sodiomyces alkalinus (strain CBS 110278 / VKM F-3762 / F11) TaxID=1314773 RepID=A0A3N2QAQ8_SODAK|nr:RabGAP/TBC [Sodiomyces alkalinus F11]ROT43745.1 RabGAP/TBC [Sodiomyces alkalinus F11]